MLNTQCCAGHTLAQMTFHAELAQPGGWHHAWLRASPTTSSRPHSPWKHRKSGVLQAPNLQQAAFLFCVRAFNPVISSGVRLGFAFLPTASKFTSAVALRLHARHLKFLRRELWATPGPCYLRNCWAHSSPFHGPLPFIFSQIRQAWQAGNLSQRKGKAPGPFHKAILLLPPGKAPNSACSRQMDLLSHVRSFTQKHSEAVKGKKKKGKKKKTEGEGVGERVLLLVGLRG